MNRPPRAISVPAAAGLFLMPGCVARTVIPRSELSDIILEAVQTTRQATDQLVNLRSLDIIVTVGFFAAAALFIMWAIRLPVPGRAVGACFLCATLALMMRAFLNAFLWPTLIAVGVTVGVFCVALLRANWRMIKAVLVCDPRRMEPKYGKKNKQVEPGHPLL